MHTYPRHNPKALTAELVAQSFGFENTARVIREFREHCEQIRAAEQMKDFSESAES